MSQGSFGEVKLWDTATGKEVLVLKGNPGLRSPASHSAPDGKLLLGAGFGGGPKDLRTH